MELAYAGQFVGALAERWWMLVVRGAAAILFGALAIAAPRMGLPALAALWAAWAIVDGAFAMALAARRSLAGRRWGWLLLEGACGIAAGSLAVVWPRIPAPALAAVMAAWAASTGVARLVAAVRLRRQVEREWSLAASGALAIALAALLAWAGRSAPALAWAAGTYAVVLGGLLAGLGLRLDRWRRAGGRATPAVGAPGPS